MNNCEKKLDALIDALGFEVEVVMRDAVGDEEPDIFLLAKDYCVDYKLTKRVDEERFTFTRYMIKDLIEVLGCHTVASNGHNNDDILTTISNLEAMIDNEEI